MYDRLSFTKTFVVVERALRVGKERRRGRGLSVVVEEEAVMMMIEWKKVYENGQLGFDRTMGLDEKD